MSNEILEKIFEALVCSGRMTTSVTTIGTAFTAITAVSTARKRLVIQNTGAATVTLAGTSATPTFTGGYYLAPQAEVNIPATSAVLIYGLASTITQIHCMEIE